MRVRAAMGARLATGAVGVAMLGFGAWNLLHVSDLDQKESIGKWLVGGVIVHDGILAPLVFGCCAVAWRLAGVRLRRGLAVFLLAGGSVAIVALPSALRSGDNPNRTVTPLDYPRNLAIVLGVLAACVLLYALGGHLVDRRRSGSATESDSALAQAVDHRASPDFEAVEAPAEPARIEGSEVIGMPEQPSGSAEPSEPSEPVDDPGSGTPRDEPVIADESTDSGPPAGNGEIVVDHDDEELDGQG